MEEYEDYDTFIKQSVLKPGGYKYNQSQIDHYKQKLREKNEFFEKQRQQQNNQNQNQYNNQIKQQKEENDDIYSQQQLFQKLGINPNYNENTDPYEQKSYKFSQAKYLENQLGIPESYIYSTKMEGVKSQVQGELLSEVDKEIEKVRQRRQNLMDRKNFEKKSDMPYKYQFENKKNKEEYIPQDVDEIIQFQWKNNQPTFEEVETELQRHRDKLKQYEKQLGIQQEEENNNINNQENNQENQKSKLLFLQNGEPQRMVDNLLQNEKVRQQNLSSINRDILEYGGYDKDQLYKENNFIKTQYQNQFQQQQQDIEDDDDQYQKQQNKSKQPRYMQIQPKYLQETSKQKKNRIINEEMKNIEEKINREAYEHFINGTKPPKLNKAVKKDQTREIRKNSKEKQYLEKFQNYKLQKKTEDVVKTIQSQQERPKFERFKKLNSHNKHIQNVQKIQSQKLDKVDINLQKK